MQVVDTAHTQGGSTVHADIIEPSHSESGCGERRVANGMDADSAARVA